MRSSQEASIARFQYLLEHMDLESYGKAMEQMNPDLLGWVLDMPAPNALAVIDDVAGGEWNEPQDIEQAQLTHEMGEMCIRNHLTNVIEAISARTQPESEVGKLSSDEFALLERMLSAD